ncbi:MAG: methyltransferase domain-containing protein [Devosia sp.]
MKAVLKSIAHRVRRTLRPAAGDAETRLEPVSRSFGFERGTPIDRYYIEKFLTGKTGLIKGRALEVGEATYLKKLGRDVSSEWILVPDKAVLKSADSNGQVVVGDITGTLTDDQGFDCFICTQTLNVVYDTTAAVRNAYDLLRPGGWFLGTVPGISQISRYDMDRWGDYWRFTSKAVERMLTDVFGARPQVEIYGNLYSSKAFLDGLALEDLNDRSVLDHTDSDYQLIIGFAAQRVAP